MGAALHLAHAQHTPPIQKNHTKGKGGGGSDRYDALVRRVYADKRQTSDSRDLILLMAWLTHRDPARHDTDLGFWERAGNILGRYKVGGREKPRLADLIAKDRPRYEIDHADAIWQHQVCAAPMIRRDGECGKHATAHADRIDVNGWRWPIWYCSRHADWGRKEGWINVYEWACKWTWNSSWKPPEPYGLRADDWPRTDAEEDVETWEPPTLRLVVANGELVGL